MRPKMRRFKIENGSATISKDGEFLHINDIMLLIINERQSAQNMIKVLPSPEKDDKWGEKSRFAYEKQIDMLNELEQHIIKAE